MFLARRRLQMTRMAQAAPTRKPVTTCESECWRSIMRAVPTAPASISTKQSHHRGLKEKAME